MNEFPYQQPYPMCGTDGDPDGIRVYIDGSARPNPGKGGIGIAIRGVNWDYDIYEKMIGNKISNNEAEYQALIVALGELMRNGTTKEDITIFSDSELLTEQMKGNRKVDKGGKYVDKYLVARSLCKNFQRIRFVHIPREQNAEANLLASRAVSG